MKQVINSFAEGVKDGIPIGLGYLSVSFTFGMMAVSMGIPLEVAVLISLTNLTSAGQFAGLELLMVNGAYIEMAMTQFIINLRYALMSLSLSQKVDSKLNGSDRALIAYAITDEIFALASNKEGRIGKTYFVGLASIPILGWTLGTLIGGGASQLLPLGIRSCLQIAIYGMFLAIIIPPAKKMRSLRIVILFSALLSCLLTFINTYFSIGSGFIIILCTVITAGLAAYFFPIKEASHD